MTFNYCPNCGRKLGGHPERLRKGVGVTACFKCDFILEDTRTPDRTINYCPNCGADLEKILRLLYPGLLSKWRGSCRVIKCPVCDKTFPGDPEPKKPDRLVSIVTDDTNDLVIRELLIEIKNLRLAVNEVLDMTKVNEA